MRWRGVFTPFVLTCLLVAGSAAALEGEAGQDGDAELSEECRAFREDANADLGDVMRAGCEPTLGQMSRLMTTHWATLPCGSIRSTGST